MKKFKKAYVEITNICNLKCHFCPETVRTPKVMNKKEFGHVIREVKPFTDYVYFHLMGEPLLNPELESFLKICGQNSLKVNITTNGTLLNKTKTVLLNASSLRKVSISLHSYEANTKEGDLTEYIADAVNFAKDASSKNIICELRLWNGDSQDIKGINKLNRYIIELLKKQLDLDFDIDAALETQNNIKLKNHLYIHIANRFEWPDIDRGFIHEEVFCYGLRDQFGVLADGTVVPCCLDSEGSIALGNLYKQPLKDILLSERAEKIYNGFTERRAVEDLCKRCGYAKRHKR